MILECIDHFRPLNEEALATRNGVKIIKPSWKLEYEAQAKREYDAKQAQLESQETSAD